MLKYILLIVICIFFFKIYIKAQPSSKTDYIREINVSTLEDAISKNNANHSLVFDDRIIEARISELNFQTPINLDYNEDVKKYIHYFVSERVNIISQSLSYSGYYFPIFETYLDKYHLPMELKYLSVIESGLNPFARSKTDAVGLWQFKLPTARLLNLKVNSFIDERQDPIKSTEAACSYLEYLYNMFNDWQLAIAAYNGGPENVKKAMLRSGKNTFWEIKPYLPQETQNYVPAFIAMIYLMNYAHDYQIQPNDKPLYYHQIDTVLISKPVYFSTLSQKLNIPIDVLRFLNPAYKQDYIPKMQNAVALVLPSEKISEFIQLQNDILCNDFPKQEQLNNNKLKKAISYTVKEGDYLTKLAINFRCSVEDIKKWNNLKSNELTINSSLIIWTPCDVSNNIIE
ncbi:MAG: transglycosylase SLT domain-containing protein [Bacteroidales bacterium]